MKTTRTKQTNCPNCKVAVDSATSLEESRPSEGDFSVCFSCGARLIFTDNNGGIKRASGKDLKILREEDLKAFVQLMLSSNEIRKRNARNN